MNWTFHRFHSFFEFLPFVQVPFLVDDEALTLPEGTLAEARSEVSRHVPVSAFLVVTFLYKVLASPSSAKTNPIIQS